MFSVCKRNYITEVTLDAVQPLKVLLSHGRSLQRSAYKPGFKGTSISYLPCNSMPLALWSLKPICHLQQKWLSFHYYLYFEHEPSCQAWVGSENPVFP